jgi:hypothetical protein
MASHALLCRQYAAQQHLRRVAANKVTANFRAYEKLQEIRRHPSIAVNLLLAQQMQAHEQMRRVSEWNSSLAEAERAEEQQRQVAYLQAIAAENQARKMLTDEILAAEQKSQVDRNVAFMYAIELEQKERTRRFLEGKMSDRFTHHFEREERARNMAYSLAAQENERISRMCTQLEDQKRAHILLQKMEPVVDKAKTRRAAENEGYDALHDALCLGGNGKKVQRLKVLCGAIDMLSALQQEKELLLEEERLLGLCPMPSQSACNAYKGSANKRMRSGAPDSRVVKFPCLHPPALTSLSTTPMEEETIDESPSWFFDLPSTATTQMGLDINAFDLSMGLEDDKPLTFVKPDAPSRLHAPTSPTHASLARDLSMVDLK